MRNKFILWGIVVLIVTWSTALLIKAHYWIPIFLTFLYILGISGIFLRKFRQRSSNILSKEKLMGNRFREIKGLRFTEGQRT